MRAAIDLSAIQDDKLYPPKEASAISGKSVKTLANERAERRGCPVTYVGKFVFYLGRDLRTFLESGRVDFSKPKQRVAKTARELQRKRAREAANAAA